MGGQIEFAIVPQLTANHGRLFWDVLSAETIELNADLSLPTGFTAALLVDHFGSSDVLRVWSVPEPTALFLIGSCSSLVMLRPRRAW
jgi:hypothetical protein